MQIETTKKDLARAVSTVSPVVNRNTLPILQGGFFQADGGQVTLTATDLEVMIKTKLLNANYIGNTPALIPLVDLKNIIKGGKAKDKVTITIGNDFKVSVDMAGMSYELQAMDHDEYPETGKVPESYVSIDNETFHHLLKHTVYAASTEETRYFLNGVYFNLEQSSTEVAATDGRRLAIAYAKPTRPKPEKTVGVIVPLNGAKVLLKAITGSPVDIGLMNSYDKSEEFNEVMFSDNITSVRTRMIDGDYPKYREILPKEHKHSVTGNTADLHNAFKQMSLIPYVNKRESHVACHFHNTCVDLRAKNRETNVLAKTSVPIIGNGVDMDIAFDGKYVVDALANIDTEETEIRLIDDLSAVVIKPHNDDSHINIVMPRRNDI